MFKEPLPASSEESKYLQYEKEVRSRIIIAHVRRATTEGRSRENTHPFKHGNWIFAHNGSVDRDYILSLLSGRYKPEGRTDSEVYFYWILHCINRKGDPMEGIKEEAARVVEGAHGP